MKLKTYTATTMAQALAQVRKDLGPEAMILHTRSYRTGSWLGLGGKPMVEITASSPQPATTRKLRKAAKPISAKDLDDRAQLMNPETMSKHTSPEPVSEPKHQQPAALIESNAKQDQAKQQDDRAILLQGLMGSTESIYAAASSTPNAQTRSADTAIDETKTSGHGGSSNELADGFMPTNFDRITSNIDLPEVTESTESKAEPATRSVNFAKFNSVSETKSETKSHSERLIDTEYEASTFRTLESINDLSGRVSTELSEHDRTLKEFTKDLRNTRLQQSKSADHAKSDHGTDSEQSVVPNDSAASIVSTDSSKNTVDAIVHPKAVPQPEQVADFKPVSAFTKPIPTEPSSDFVSYTPPEPAFEIQPPANDSDSMNTEASIEIPRSATISSSITAPTDTLVDSNVASDPQNKADSQNPEALQAQINILQKMMGQVLETTRRTAVAVDESSQHAPLPPIQLSESLSNAHASMVDNDVPADIADRFVQSVMDRLDHDELDDASVVRHAMLREIEHSIHTVSDSVISRSSSTSATRSGRPKVLALIGPTGVGKTTTVAKLAATAKLRHGMSVALITSDTYRIAAVEQLKTYASIIGLELRIANNPEEMKAQIESLGDRDLVVIDTAGRSQNNHSKLDELGDLITAAQPDETHLVLSATVGDNVLRKTAARFRELGPDRCILTKIDEAVTTGMIASVQDRIGLPLSFVTVGQEVPDDILPARADRLARAVLDGPESLVPHT